MQLIEIYRSANRAACEDRAFVLRAVGIGSEIIRVEELFALCVPSDAVILALDHLRQYETENARPIAPVPTLVAHAHAWIAPSVYALYVLVIAFLAGRAALRTDWYELGALRASLLQTQEWWRPLTALSLHADHQHLLTNLGFGAVFLYIAARMTGFGIALAATMVAAVFGNLLDSALMPITHAAIGASTWVFATLGFVAAYSWRIQLNGRSKWAHRWAPLIAGVMLLGLIGTGGENTDVLAHLTGFACGVIAAVLASQLPTRAFTRVSVQAFATMIAMSLFVIGWIWAFAA